MREPFQCTANIRKGDQSIITINWNNYCQLHFITVNDVHEISTIFTRYSRVIETDQKQILLHIQGLNFNLALPGDLGSALQQFWGNELFTKTVNIARFRALTLLVFNRALTLLVFNRALTTHRYRIYFC